MERTEVIKLIDFITIHRPNFKSRLGDKIFKDMVNDWTRIMGAYDYEDVFDNLETFFQNENNYGREPDAYQLIRGLLTTEDKKTNSLGRVSCMFCGRWFNRLEIHEHEDRCRSIKYLQKVYRNYFSRELEDLPKLYDMNNQDFEKAYMYVLEKALPMVTDPVERKGITNVIETYYGREPKYGIGEI